MINNNLEICRLYPMVFRYFGEIKIRANNNSEQLKLRKIHGLNWIVKLIIRCVNYTIGQHSN